MNKILILFAHPALQKSRVNIHLVEQARTVHGVTVHDLYEEYPEMDIDVPREQQLLLDHDIIAFHHPFFWYSVPPILKEWQDLVLAHGWAYGSTGDALAGKLFFNAMTAGGRRDAYAKDGYNRFTVRQFLAPLEQTAHLCGMRFLPPFVVHGTHAITPEQVRRAAAAYRSLLEQLRDGLIDADAAGHAAYLNDLLNTDAEQ